MTKLRRTRDSISARPRIIGVWMRLHDVALLFLLGATCEQDDDLRAVLAEIHPVAGTKVDLQLEHTRADPFDVRRVTEFKAR